MSENPVFEVFQYDNGPDYIEEGLFRVKRNGKIGYADRIGNIVIPCQFECAYPFSDGVAKVSTNCQEIVDLDHYRWKSEEWYFIDKNGMRVNK